MWRPEVRFSNLLLGLLSNIRIKPLSSDSNTRERNIKSFIFIFPSGGMQSLCWLTEPQRKEGLFLFSPLLPHDLIYKRSSNTTILLIRTNLCCCSSFAWIFLFLGEVTKKEEKSGRKKCPSLEPVLTDASLCLPLWMGGIVSTRLNSAILSNCVKQR